ncbi:Rab GAP Gyp10 [Schizosaccharomyces osmophilus]|uniref:Rab GAP Gyp10 n=1 Tax=Schizosaccharomyces osmophilus TaxID=2545709 RepID=A0AAF0AWL6_9SCHI|nr:Rab GAP Gyp10 [Schizosaccharomyces osmophilus]WBW72994.1 Rab GAP Gyp10 [Schizosaccharomyces osmophilus]
MKKKELKKRKDDVKVGLINFDLDSLSQCGKTGHGFLMKSYRKSAWTLLCGISSQDRMECFAKSAVQSSYADQVQVHLDSERSFFQYKLNPILLRKHRSQLIKLLSTIFKRYPELCYYQGLHDIAQIVLLTLPYSHALPLMEHLMFHRLRDFMLPTLDATIKQLHLVLEIIRYRDFTLYEYLKKADVQCYFALSWLITWFAHDISEISVVGRLFDFFISSHPSAVVYTCAQIVMDDRKKILDLSLDNNGADILHTYLCKLPSKCDVEQLIQNTCATMSSIDITSLPLDKLNISPFSSLRNQGPPWEYSHDKNGMVVFRLLRADHHDSGISKQDWKLPLFFHENIFTGCNMITAITVIGVGIVASQLMPKSSVN